MHESGAGVGRTEDGFIVMVDGVLPEARARVEITRVHSNHARAEELEILPMPDDEDDEETDSGVDAGARRTMTPSRTSENSWAVERTSGAPEHPRIEES